MSMEIIRKRQPSCSLAAMLAVIFLAAVLFGLGAAFAYLLISGRGNNYLLGTLLAFEFLTAGVAIIVYARNFIVFREVSEDRDEELLW